MTKEQNHEWGCEVSIHCTTCERGNPPPPWDLGMRTFADFAPLLIKAHKSEAKYHRMRVTYHRDVQVVVSGDEDSK